MWHIAREPVVSLLADEQFAMNGYCRYPWVLEQDEWTKQSLKKVSHSVGERWTFSLSFDILLSITGGSQPKQHYTYRKTKAAAVNQWFKETAQLQNC